jgi:hypothetical protein
MGPIRCPETSANNYHTTPHNTPEDRRFHQHRGGSLKSRLLLTSSASLCVYKDKDIQLSVPCLLCCPHCTRSYLKAHRSKVSTNCVVSTLVECLHSLLNKRYIKLIHRKEARYKVLNTGCGAEKRSFLLHDPLSVGVLK